MNIHRLALIAALACGASAQVSIRGFSPAEARNARERETQAGGAATAANIRDYARWMAAEPHAAGSARSKLIAETIASRLRAWGLDANVEAFEALLPYPTARVLELTGPKHFVAHLHEPPVAGDPDTGQPGQLPTYNAFSASGDVTAPLVYANYGIPEDYAELAKRGIDVRGKIVITRYGRSWRGVKPKLAADHGAVGCLIYSDPREDGYYQGDVYPAGPFRPGAGVQRGSVVDMALYPGDPLTPGWAGEAGERKLQRAEARSLMTIPVLPISADDALPLLRAMAGPVAPESWRGALPLTYHIGPSTAPVHLKLDFDWTVKPLYNVIATIPGSTAPDEWVLWGNHHDAWVNGASDPVSGASALMEAARSLAEATRKGWKPRRTLKLAFWDGEEFGLMGSTEWAEKHRAELDEKLSVYLNSDANGRGRLSASGSHALETFVNEIARDLTDPVSGKRLAEVTSARGSKMERLGALGAGSDYVAFIDHIGVSSLNLSFGGDDDGGVYHSIYDNNRWFERFSDGKFLYGRALAQVVVAAMMRLGDAQVLPYDFGPLARTIRGYAEEIRKDAPTQVDLSEVLSQVARLEANSKSYDEALRAADWNSAKLAAVNRVLYRSERALAGKGLPGRDWYRHTIYAPGRFTGYGAKTLPGIREAVEASRWDEANREAANVVQALKAFNAQVEEAIRLLRLAGS